jgi:hypothetical protein
MLEGMPYGLVIAMASGLFGASFFMMVELQRRIAQGGVADVRDMWTVPMLLLRCIVGVGAASILYFFFRSGLLEGSLWPDLGALGFQPVARVMDGEGREIGYLNAGRKIVPNTAFALLIVWSFIAGYSQTLVPNLLLSTEGRMG